MTEPLRIGYISSVYPRASDTFVRGEVSQLRKLGFEVIPFSVRRPEKGQLLTDEVLRESKQTTYLLGDAKFTLLTAFVSQSMRAPARMLSALRLAWRTGNPGIVDRIKLIAYLAEAAKCAGRMRKAGVRLLHNHIAENSATVAMLASEMSGIPFSMTVHGPGIFFHPRRWALGEKIARSSFTVCISHFCKSQCMIFAAPDHWERLKVVRCGVDREVLESPTTPIPAEPRFVCVGRLCAEKGQVLLVEAIRRLRDRGVYCELELVGDGELRRQVEAAILQSELQDRVRVLGWMSHEEVLQKVRGARALVLPSFAEGLPVVIMEAMALGRPVISSRIAAIGELVEEGVSGWLTPPSDIDQLVDVMERAATAEPQRLAEMGRRGAQRVAAQHDAMTEAERLAGLMRDCLADDSA